MANVRCPMCSKLNPPEAEVCAYCGARLKPLRPPSAKQPAAEPSKTDEPDWLKQLRADGPDLPPEEDHQSGAAVENSDVPDWLSRIRDRAKTETSSPSNVFGEEKEEEADWMKSLQGEDTSDQGLSDWLSRIPGGQEEEKGPAQPPASKQPAIPAASEPPAAGFETPDWLRGLSDETAASQGASIFGENVGEQAGGQPPADFGEPAAADSGAEDWFSKLSAWQTGSEANSEPENTTPSATAS